jgi:hypothetical protein
MNRTLQYLKNIKYNQLLNKVIANKGKKKYSINITHRTPNYQQNTIRKFTTNPSFNNPRNPPDKLIFISLLCLNFINIANMRFFITLCFQ